MKKNASIQWTISDNSPFQIKYSTSSSYSWNWSQTHDFRSQFQSSHSYHTALRLFHAESHPNIVFFSLLLVNPLEKVTIFKHLWYAPEIAFTDCKWESQDGKSKLPNEEQIKALQRKYLFDQIRLDYTDLKYKEYDLLRLCTKDQT